MSHSQIIGRGVPGSVLDDPWISGEGRLELVMCLWVWGKRVPDHKLGLKGSLPCAQDPHTPVPLPLAQHDGLQQLLQGLPAAPAASGVDGVFLPRTRLLLDGLRWPIRKPAHSPPEVGKAIPAEALGPGHQKPQDRPQVLPALSSRLHTCREKGWARCTRTQTLGLRPQHRRILRTARAPVHNPSGVKACREGGAE